MAEKLRIIVGGMVGQYPMGGVAWDYFHYVLALAELGHDVYYHEDTWVWPHDPVKGYATDDPNYTVRFIADFFERYAPHLKDRWHYSLLHETSYGMTREAFDAVAKSADIFLNVSGACFVPDHLNPRAVKVFMDTDPGYNQIVLATRPAWSENVDRWIAQVRAHDVHLTYAENLGQPDCLAPTLDLDWRPTRCVVTLPSWKAVEDAPAPKGAAWTTVMSWAYWPGKLEYKGVEYDAKASEYARFHDLPRRTNVPLTLAVGGHHQPAEQIRADGWNLVNARELTRTTEGYVDFIAGSRGEWSVAKNVFVAMKTGWFSCRTACYLAAGRPAVVQDTGWSKFVPSGAGVIAFSTLDEAVAGLEACEADYARHAEAAYGVAHDYLAPERVLPQMLESIAGTPTRPASKQF